MPVPTGNSSPETLPAALGRAQGVIQRLYIERGFGFIRCHKGPAPEDLQQDFFFHASGLDDCHIAELEEGEPVEFEPRRVAKGRRAEHITRGWGRP